MLRNRLPGRHPNLPLRPRAQELHEPLQRHEPTGLADDPAMQADRHHLGRAGLALGKQDFEGAVQVVVELVGREGVVGAVEFEVVVVVAAVGEGMSCRTVRDGDG